MKVLHTIRDTPANPHGLCALSISNDNCYLAYPGSNQIGEVQIFDTVNLVSVHMIYIFLIKSYIEDILRIFVLVYIHYIYYYLIFLFFFPTL